MSLWPGRKTKENLACRFHSFLQVLETGFPQRSPTSTGRHGYLKPATLPNAIGQIGDRTGQSQYHYFDVQGAAILQATALFIDSNGS